LLREAGSCSRADLVRASGLSAPTVTNVVDDLLTANLIQPLGEGESSGGRPPDMISFKSDRGCLLAVQIAASHLSFLLSDLSGKQIDAAQVSLAERRTNPDSICHLIGAEMRLLLKKQRINREQLLAMVVAVPAIANVDEGLVISISTLENWRNVPLRGLLGKIVECPVVVENDTNLAALGEHHRGGALFHQSFVLIMIGANVSAGIVLSGRIHHGAQWAAGEIGYLRLPHVARKHPALHEFGELEHVLTSSAILKSWLSDANASSRKPGTAATDVDAKAVLDLAQAGDSSARKIVQVRAAIAADIIVNLSLILNPDLILLGGEVGSHPAMLNSIQKQLQRSEFAIPEVAAAGLGNFAILWGGIALALEMTPSLLLPEPGD
jgi:glucokinase